MAGLLKPTDTNVRYLSRSDPDETLGAWSAHPFVLEDKKWPTVEHYYQAMKFDNEQQQEKIRAAQSPKQARKLGRTRFQKIRHDWRAVRKIYMTRALYTKCKTYSNLAQELLDTGDAKLVESSVYDYYWGCGRDRRGTNMYGQLLENVRERLQQEAAAQEANNEQ